MAWRFESSLGHQGIKMSKASDFLCEYVLCIPDCYKAPWTKVGPGGLIEKMSPENRELLATLKSEDLRNIRPDTIFGTPENWKKWGCAPPKTKGRFGRR
jgi:hypothetical protein